MNYKPISYTRQEDVFTVKLERVDSRNFYVDVWIDSRYKDVDCDWHQYIFDLTNEEDVARRDIQADNDEFDDATSTAICFLEEEGAIYQNDKAEWFIDDVEDFDLNEEVPVFQVWLLGYDENDSITDFEYLVNAFTKPDAAINCAETIIDKGLKSIKNVDDAFYIPADVKTVNILVETVVKDPDGNDENIETLYDEFIKGEF